MQIELKTTTNTTQETYTIRLNDGTTYHYTEWLDDRGKVIDMAILDKDGYEVFDSALLEQIQNLVDGYDIK